MEELNLFNMYAIKYTFLCADMAALRPATSTQVFLGFPVYYSKCWDGSQ